MVIQLLQHCYKGNILACVCLHTRLACSRIRGLTNDRYIAASKWHCHRTGGREIIWPCTSHLAFNTSKCSSYVYFTWRK